MINVRTPVLVVSVLVTVLAGASCHGQKGPRDRQDPCAQGCEVPNAPRSDEVYPPVDIPVAVPSCDTTADKGPCTTILEGTDGQYHWWYVEIGHTLYDGTVIDLGVMEDL